MNINGCVGNDDEYSVVNCGIAFEKLLFVRFGADDRTGAGSPTVDVLPATVEYRDDAEDDFVRLVLSDVNVDALEFKLTPTYVVYMAIRHRLMHGFRLHVDHKQRAHVIAALTTKVANTAYHIIQVK